MPLNPLTLINAIREFADPDYSGFLGHPLSEADAAIKWASAYKRYMSGISNPAPSPGALAGLEAAEKAMIGVLAGMAAPPPLGIAALQGGFAAFAGTFALTTAPFVSIPPPAPIPIIPTPPLAGLPAATKMAGIIDIWTRSGTSSVPPVSPIPWA